MNTLKDIAVKAGCSIRTVSRAVNRNGKVSEETRKKILDIANELNYLPDPGARSLKTGKKYTIGLIQNTIDSDVNRIRLETVNSLFNTAGYAMLVNRAANISIEKEIIPELRVRADALIINTNLTQRNLPVFDELKRADYPFILLDPESPTDYPSVYINRLTGYRDAVVHLYEKNKRNMCLILEDNKRTQRIQGFKAGLKHINKRFSEDMIIDTAHGFEGGYNIGYKIKSFIKESGLNGIICQSDEIAAGLLHYLRENSIEIPEEAAIVGFDNDNFSAYTFPPLTTIAQGGNSVGVYIYQQLFNRLEYNIQMQNKNFNTELIIRKSS